MGLIIFDLDGTLVDSKRDLCRAVNHVRSAHGLRSLLEEEVTSMVGSGARALIDQALRSAPSVDLEAALQMFLNYYRDHMLDETRLYPGVDETLDMLKDCDLAVLTNKPYRFSCRMLQGLGIYHRFKRIYGGNSFERKKPDPVGIRQILSDTNASLAQTIMVGDSAIDVKTGRAAGVRTCGVTYGYAPQTFVEHPPDHRIDRIEELPGVVSSYLY